MAAFASLGLGHDHGSQSLRASAKQTSRTHGRRRFPALPRFTRNDAWVFRSACGLLIGLGISILAAQAEAKPSRIVSMNLCADELLLRLADRERIASVTWLAADPRGSTVTAEAAGHNLNHGLAEEVAGLRPDLVLAGVYTARTATNLLKRFGMPPVELGVPQDFEALRAQVRQVAAAIGEPERGAALIADLDARLAAARPQRPSGLRALVMRPNALTVSPGSFGDAILRAAGLVNVAAELGRGGAGQVPLEVAAFADADLVILDEDQGAASLANAILHHPVFRRLAESGRIVTIPNRLWTCPGPQAAEVVRRLAGAAEARPARGASLIPLLISLANSRLSSPHEAGRFALLGSHGEGVEILLAPLAGRGLSPPCRGRSEAAAEGEGAIPNETFPVPTPYLRFGFASASRMDDEVHAGLSPEAGRGWRHGTAPEDGEASDLGTCLAGAEKCESTSRNAEAGNRVSTLGATR